MMLETGDLVAIKIDCNLTTSTNAYDLSGLTRPHRHFVKDTIGIIVHTTYDKNIHMVTAYMTETFLRFHVDSTTTFLKRLDASKEKVDDV